MRRYVQPCNRSMYNPGSPAPRPGSPAAVGQRSWRAAPFATRRVEPKNGLPVERSDGRLRGPGGL